jgi:hypothetical protein
MGNKTLARPEIVYNARVKILPGGGKKTADGGRQALLGRRREASIFQAQEALYCSCFGLTWLSTAYT